VQRFYVYIVESNVSQARETCGCRIYRPRIRL